MGINLLGNPCVFEEAYDVIVLEDWMDSTDVKCPDSAEEHLLNQLQALEQPIFVGRLKKIYFVYLKKTFVLYMGDWWWGMQLWV